MDNHRIIKPPFHHNAGTAQHHHVELDVLPHFGNLCIFKQWFQSVQHRFDIGPITRNIPRFMRFHGKR